MQGCILEEVVVNKIKEGMQNYLRNDLQKLIDLKKSYYERSFIFNKNQYLFRNNSRFSIFPHTTNLNLGRVLQQHNLIIYQQFRTKRTFITCTKARM